MDRIKGGLFGLTVGDALGVPVEFMERNELVSNPVDGMRGYGTHGQPAGTWSDDSSLMFCLAEAMLPSFELQRAADYFVAWEYKNFWTPHGKVFDVGMATHRAIARMARGIRPELAGGFDEGDNGNGSLMRILPLLFHLNNKPITERYALTKQVSSFTHAHIRSVIGCFYYLEFARELLAGTGKADAYRSMQSLLPSFLETQGINPDETARYGRLLSENIARQPVADISSSGYVVHTLEATVWSLLNTSGYREAVLTAVNLGEDTDTTGAVTGGLAGLLYGYEAIPAEWLAQLARKEDVADLVARFETVYGA